MNNAGSDRSVHREDPCVRSLFPLRKRLGLNLALVFFPLAFHALAIFTMSIGTPQIIVPLLRKGGPPTVLYTYSGPSDRVHHPDNAKAVHEKCKKVGVYCELYGSKKSGLPELPDGENIPDVVMKLFYKTWKLPHPDGNKPEAQTEPAPKQLKATANSRA